MLNIFFIKIFFLFSSFIVEIKSEDNLELLSLSLNIPSKGSIPDNSYHFYQLSLGQILYNYKQNLIIRVDEDKSNTLSGQTSEKNQYYFSDPDIYVSQENKYPKNVDTSTWYCDEFGNDIVAIKGICLYK